jgi:hypothetical protein
MLKLIDAISEFVADPMNMLIFLFLWVGVALIASNAPLDVAAVVLNLMALPAVLGYFIGRKRK